MGEFVQAEPMAPTLMDEEFGDEAKLARPLQPSSGPGSPEVPRNTDSGDSSSSLDGDSSVARPDLSYAHLAALAIDASGLKRCTVGEIYAWIETRYPFFKSGCPWWKNCIRHNLSMKKSFIRIQGDGVNMWAINPAHYDDLLHNKRRRASNASSTHPPAPAAPSPAPAAVPAPAYTPPAPSQNIFMGAPAALASNTMTSLAMHRAPCAAPPPCPPPAALSPMTPTVHVVPSSPGNRKRSSPPSSRSAKVPRSPRARPKRLITNTTSSVHSVDSTPSAEPLHTSLRGRVDDLWLVGDRRSPSPNLFHFSPPPINTSTTMRPMNTTAHVGVGGFMSISHVPPGNSSQRALFTSTPDLMDSRNFPDNWFSLDYSLNY